MLYTISIGYDNIWIATVDALLLPTVSDLTNRKESVLSIKRNANQVILPMFVKSDLTANGSLQVSPNVAASLGF